MSQGCCTGERVESEKRTKNGVLEDVKGVNRKYAPMTQTRKARRVMGVTAISKGKVPRGSEESALQCCTECR